MIDIASSVRFLLRVCFARLLPFVRFTNLCPNKTAPQKIVLLKIALVINELQIKALQIKALQINALKINALKINALQINALKINAPANRVMEESWSENKTGRAHKAIDQLYLVAGAGFERTTFGL